jgi:hypothetical protein
VKFRLLLLVLLLTAALRLVQQDSGAQSKRAEDAQSANAAARPNSKLASDPLVPPIQVTSNQSSARSGPESELHVPVVAVGPAEFAHSPRAIFEPHGHAVCASGCAASRHPTGKLSADAFRSLLAQFATEPVDETSLALETLLFYGRQTRDLLASHGSAPLDPLREAVLQRELQYTHATVEIRVVDEKGTVRSWLPPTRVPLDRRHVFAMEVRGVQPLVTSGTVKRVGLYHLWTRL